MRKLAALFAMLAILASPITVLADGPVAPGPDSDPEMAAAFRNANDTLNRRGIAAKYNSLKVAFAVNAPDMTVELIWVSQIHRISDSKFEGRLDNYPQHITGKHYQSRVSFTRDQIRDWGHLSFDGKLYGHYTTRLLATSMPDEKAQKILQILSKDPIPANWKTP